MLHLWGKSYTHVFVGYMKVPETCNQNVRRLKWIMKFPEKGHLVKPGYHPKLQSTHLTKDTHLILITTMQNARLAW